MTTVLVERYRRALERISFGESNPQSIAHDALNKPYQAKVYENLVGRRFTRLEVIHYAGVHTAPGDTQRRRYWLCMCDCGNLTAVSTTGLKRKCKQSCGCLATETAAGWVRAISERRRRRREERLVRRREFYRRRMEAAE